VLCDFTPGYRDAVECLIRILAHRLKLLRQGVVHHRFDAAVPGNEMPVAAQLPIPRAAGAERGVCGFFFKCIGFRECLRRRGGTMRLDGGAMLSSFVSSSAARLRALPLQPLFARRPAPRGSSRPSFRAEPPRASPWIPRSAALLHARPRVRSAARVPRQYPRALRPAPIPSRRSPAAPRPSAANDTARAIPPQLAHRTSVFSGQLPRHLRRVRLHLWRSFRLRGRRARCGRFLRAPRARKIVRLHR